MGMLICRWKYRKYHVVMEFFGDVLVVLILG